MQVQVRDGLTAIALAVEDEASAFLAHAQGLGAVWIGVYPAEGQVRGVRERLGIPETVVPFSIVSLGHPAEQLPPEDRFDRTRIHANGW